MYYLEAIISFNLRTKAIAQPIDRYKSESSVHRSQHFANTSPQTTKSALKHPHRQWVFTSLLDEVLFTTISHLLQHLSRLFSYSPNREQCLIWPLLRRPSSRIRGTLWRKMFLEMEMTYSSGMDMFTNSFEKLIQ